MLLEPLKSFRGGEQLLDATCRFWPYNGQLCTRPMLVSTLTGKLTKIAHDHVLTFSSHPCGRGLVFPTWFPASYAILTGMVAMSYAVRRPVPFAAPRGVEPLSSLKMNTGFQLNSNQYLQRCSFRRLPFCLRRKSKLLAPSFLGQLNFELPYG